MKTINESFTDEEFEFLLNKKKGQSWHDYILCINLDPKKQFLALLSNKQNTITNYIANSSYSSALRQIVLLLHSIDVPENEEAVLKLKESLTLQNYRESSIDEIEDAYVIVCDFLNRVCFKDFCNKPKLE